MVVSESHEGSCSTEKAATNKVRHSSLRGMRDSSNASPCRIAAYMAIVMLSGYVPSTLSTLEALSTLVRTMCIAGSG